MALFAAPIAHEDHAQRACAAALDLARELGALAEHVRRESRLEFAVRMGLNSGEVVVGRIGDDLRMDYTAQGHVVGLAARVQQLAPPGGISVTEQTARLASGFFDFLDRGEQSLKGASVPVRVFELRGHGQIRSRLERSRARGFSRFVGREPELALLESALREAQAGRPKAVLITAEPGAGKSRLCHEFVERARGEPTLLWVAGLHWLDPASEAALEMLNARLVAPASADCRVLLLATARPEYRPAWSTRAESLSLAPLALQDSQTLLDDWLGPD